MNLAIKGSIPLITRGTCRDGDNLQEMEYDSEGSERELWRDWPANEKLPSPDNSFPVLSH